VRLAAFHLAEQNEGRPLYIVGYSTGAALAVHYALAALEDERLPRIERVVLLSPAIGVSSVAALAVWQARLGHLLGLDKLAWNSILPEYDPFKYGSFAVNAGDVVYQLTLEIQARVTALEKTGLLRELPPILALSSIVDATVSTPALVKGLFERLPSAGHELVLFDINYLAGMEHIMQWNPRAVLQALRKAQDREFTLSLVSNDSRGAVSEEGDGRALRVYSTSPRGAVETNSDPGLSWPAELYSLAHVALPFPPDDPVYGGHPVGDSPGIYLGDFTMRCERGVLRISPSDMLRLRWNPF
jgi:acetyl esterase/lipase